MYYQCFDSSENCERIGLKQMVRDQTNFYQDDFISNLEDSISELNSNLATQENNSYIFNRFLEGVI